MRRRHCCCALTAATVVGCNDTGDSTADGTPTPGAGTDGTTNANATAGTVPAGTSIPDGNTIDKRPGVRRLTGFEP